MLQYTAARHMESLGDFIAKHVAMTNFRVRHQDVYHHRRAGYPLEHFRAALIAIYIGSAVAVHEIIELSDHKHDCTLNGKPTVSPVWIEQLLVAAGELIKPNSEGPRTEVFDAVYNSMSESASSVVLSVVCRVNRHAPTPIY